MNNIVSSTILFLFLPNVSNESADEEKKDATIK